MALYCLALDYLDIKRNYSEKKFTIPELRKFLGLGDNEYARVVDLNKHILKRAEAEINKTSDMNLEILPVREAKQKITGFKFIMSIKKEQLSFYNTPQLKEPGDILNDKDKPDYPLSLQLNLKDEKLIGFLVQNNISLLYVEARLNDISNQIGKDNLESYLVFLMEYTNSEELRGTPIKSIGGFYINLIKDNSQLTNYLFSLENENKRKKETDKKIKAIFEKKLKEEYNKFTMQNFVLFLENILESDLPIFSQMIEEISESNPFIRDTVASISRKHPDSYNNLLIRNSIILSQLFEKADCFNFEKPVFDEWKTDFTNNPENKLRLEKLNIESEKEVRFN